MNNISDTILSDDTSYCATKRSDSSRTRFARRRERDPKKEEMSAELVVDQLGEMGFSAFSSTRSTADSGWT